MSTVVSPEFHEKQKGTLEAKLFANASTAGPCCSRWILPFSRYNTGRETQKTFITLCLLETKLDLLCWGCCKRERLTDRADWVGMGVLFWRLDPLRPRGLPPTKQQQGAGVCMMEKHALFRVFQNPTVNWQNTMFFSCSRSEDLCFLFLFICLYN